MASKDFKEAIALLAVYYLHKDSGFLLNEKNLTPFLQKHLSAEDIFQLFIIYEITKRKNTEIFKSLEKTLKLAELKYFEESIIELEKIMNNEIKRANLNNEKLDVFFNKLIDNNLLKIVDIAKIRILHELRNKAAHEIGKKTDLDLFYAFTHGLKVWSKLFFLNENGIVVTKLNKNKLTK